MSVRDETDVDRDAETLDGELVRPTLDPMRARQEQSTGDISASGTLITPQEALQKGEIWRMRFFLRLALLLVLVAALTTPFVNGHETSKQILYLGMAMVLASSSWLLWKLHQDEANYTPRRVFRVAVFILLGTLLALQFYGAFASTTIILGFGVFFYGLSESFRDTFIIYLATAALLLVMLVGDATDTFANLGLIRGMDVDPIGQAVLIVFTQSVLLACFVTARNSRSAQHRAVELHTRVVRDLAQREALLQEARRDLERVLKPGNEGRYSSQVLGHYRLGLVLGRGAMGEVYEANHVESGEPAAVKVLPLELLRQPSAVSRFLREAQIAASLRDEHIVRVFEIGQIDQGELPFIAMERLEGLTLTEVLRQDPRLSLRAVVDLASEIAQGLEAAHQAGIVHRDLKPANLFRTHVEGRAVWKILDFGVSKLVNDSQEGMQTVQGAIVGTPEYMAPEQAAGEQVDARVDTYALGVICYRALTGQPAFSGEQILGVLAAVARRLPPRPSMLVPRLGQSVDDVLRIAMAKDPARRFQTAAELAEALTAAKSETLPLALSRRAEKLAAELPWSDLQRLSLAPPAS